MATTYQQRWSDPSPSQSRRRGGSMLLAIIIHLLILLLLLKLAPLPEDHERSGTTLKTFQVATGHAATTATKHAKVAPKQAARSAAPTRPKPRVQIPSHSAATTSTDASAIWALGKGMFKGSDIAAIPSAKQGDATEMAEAGGGEGDSQAAGTGPGGNLLYNAQWYREPNDAEMRTYLPHSIAPSSWAMIICQTAPRYRVENCRELEESPPGAGLTRALRQAAWQFKVTPPRVNGKQMIGAWVRIRFDFTENGDIRVRH